VLRGLSLRKIRWSLILNADLKQANIVSLVVFIYVACGAFYGLSL
jgi:hypothetical protein